MYKVKNPYYKNSKIDEEIFIDLIKHFSNDLSASDTAEKTGISVRSVNDIYLKIRIRLSEIENQPSIHVKTISAARKINGRNIRCELIQESKSIYTSEIDSDENDSLIQQTHKTGVVDYAEAVEIDKFIAFARDRLKKFKGLSSKTFSLHLKESAFRFNHKKQNIAEVILRMLKTSPI